MDLRQSHLLALSVLLASACGSDPKVAPTPDAGPVKDTGPFDSGTKRPVPRDASIGPQGDAGFSDPNTILEGKTSLDGVQIYLHIRGTLTSTMPPVLFLNTGPSHGLEYLIEPMDFLLPGRLLVFFDLRSTGRSGFGSLTSTAGITVDAHITDVENVVAYVDDLVGAPTVDLVGHGYGAGIASLYSAQHPDRVGRMVLTAPYPATILQHALWNAELSARLSTADRERILQITRQPDCRGDVKGCSLELWRIQGPHHFCEENQDLFDTMTFQHMDFRAGFIYIDLELRDASYDWTSSLALVTADTTIISGPCDPIPSETAETYRDRIQGSVHHVLPNTGHFPMVEAASAYQALLKGVLTYP